MKPKDRKDAVTRLAQEEGNAWRGHPYFDEAEPNIDKQWQALVWPMIKDCDFSSVIDLATGHGRNAKKLAEHADKLTLVDILDENIEFVRKRFGDDPKFRYIVNSGTDLAEVEDDSITLIYSFDAMVHFDSDVVRSYLAEFHRVMKPGARGFCHHSNNTAEPTKGFHGSVGARNFMSKELFEHYAFKEGLRVVDARVIDWTRPELDCLTLFEKPAD